MSEEVKVFLAIIVGSLIGSALGSLYSTNRHIRRITEACEDTCKMVKALHDYMHSEEFRKGEDQVSGNAPKYGWRPPLPRGEKGAASFTTIGIVLCLVIVVASLLNTISANRAQSKTTSQVATISQNLADQAEIRDRENACTTSVLFSTIDALGQRTQYTTDQADANIALQKAQLRLLQTPPTATQAQGRAALEVYVKALTAYVKAVTRAKNAAVLNPYPTKEEYTACLAQARQPQPSDQDGEEGR